MIRILVESDHFLKILAVMLDPETPAEHRSAVADFFADDAPDFLSDCEKFGAKIPGLYPARVTFAEDQADLEAKLRCGCAHRREPFPEWASGGETEASCDRAEIRRYPL